MKYDIDKMEVRVDYLGRAIGGDVGSVVDAFRWDETPQGYDFWVGQRDGKTPLDIDAMKDIKRQYMHHTGTAGKLKDMHVKVGDVVRNSAGDFEYTAKERRPGVMALWSDRWGGWWFVDADKSESDYTLISLAEDAQHDAQRDTPKTWRDMTDDERVDVLYEKLKGAPSCIRGKNRVRCVLLEIGAIKPEPVRKTVAMYGRNFDGEWSFGSMEPSYDTHRITFDTIDGQPDCSTIKMERITKEECK